MPLCSYVLMILDISTVRSISGPSCPSSPTAANSLNACLSGFSSLIFSRLFCFQWPCHLNCEPINFVYAEELIVAGVRGGFFELPNGPFWCPTYIVLFNDFLWRKKQSIHAFTFTS